MLSNKKAIVTGASKGIGKEIALAMAKAGADVLIHYCSEEKLANSTCEAIQKFGRNAYLLKADFTNSAETKSFIDNAVQRLGDIDVLVNCAAAYHSKPFLDITPEQFNWMHQVNAEAPIVFIQSFAHFCQAKNKPGSIINISSISGTMPSINSTLNSCSKASLNMLTRCAALELAKHSIRVNSIVLGLIDTESNFEFKTQDPEGWQKALSEIPIGRAGKPHDCDQLAVFLASDQASWITGAIIPVDGGMTISWKS